jgi:hypothetical protein
MKKMNTKLFSKIADAHKFIKENREDGCICPCCGKVAKVYKRKLNSGMCIELITLYKLTKRSATNTFFHHTKFAKVTGGEISKLVNWGLVVEKTKDDEDITNDRISGYWKITKKGINFVENRITVKSHVYLYNNELLGFSSLNANIIDCLGKKFSYHKLMK